MADTITVKVYNSHTTDRSEKKIRLSKPLLAEIGLVENNGAGTAVTNIATIGGQFVLWTDTATVLNVTEGTTIDITLGNYYEELMKFVEQKHYSWRLKDAWICLQQTQGHIACVPSLFPDELCCCVRLLPSLQLLRPPPSTRCSIPHRPLTILLSWYSLAQVQPQQFRIQKKQHLRSFGDRAAVELWQALSQDPDGGHQALQLRALGSLLHVRPSLPSFPRTPRLLPPPPRMPGTKSRTASSGKARRAPTCSSAATTS
jgi:hypothetical protein